MMHSLTEEPAGQVPDTTPSASAETARRDGLDWDAFRDLYYPDSRRHGLAAIVAYGEYRRRRPGEPPQAGLDTEGGRRSSHAAPLEAWEGEGGAAGRAA